MQFNEHSLTIVTFQAFIEITLRLMLFALAQKRIATIRIITVGKKSFCEFRLKAWLKSSIARD